MKTENLSLDVKKDFPIFENVKNLVYLDSAATSQRPKTVIDSIKNFYEKENANIHRGVYILSEKATKNYENARKKIAGFINAEPEEVVFTKNTTESINLLAYTIKSLVSEGRNAVVLTEVEHHSNLIPWQEFAKKHKMKLKFIKITEDFQIDLKDAEKKITKKTAILSFAHVSNVLGAILPAKKLVELGKRNGAITIVDAAQSVGHIRVDVKELDCDFLAFSSHKMFGPTGVGVLYGRKDLLEKLPPFLFGGGMIKEVGYEKATYSEIPQKYEAGTQNTAGVIGLSIGVDYIKKIGIEKIADWENELLRYALRELGKIKEVKIYNPGGGKSSSIISFEYKEVHSHDVAAILSEYNVCVRAGHHCAMPLMKKLRVTGLVRVSFGVFNTFDDVDELVNGLKKVKEIFKK